MPTLDEFAIPVYLFSPSVHSAKSQCQNTNSRERSVRLAQNIVPITPSHLTRGQKQQSRPTKTDGQITYTNHTRTASHAISLNIKNGAWRFSHGISTLAKIAVFTITWGLVQLLNCTHTISNHLQLFLRFGMTFPTVQPFAFPATNSAMNTYSSGVLKRNGLNQHLLLPRNGHTSHSFSC